MIQPNDEVGWLGSRPRDPGPMTVVETGVPRTEPQPPSRDPDALATLPDSERQAWRNLWEEVGALLRKAAGASQSSDELPRNPFAP